MKLDSKRIIIIGLGFFSISISWSVYNAFVPVFLDRIIKSSFLIGLIMTTDNIFGVIFQPLFGKLSDKTNTKFGRRMPFLIIGIPGAAIAFMFIPLHTNLIALMAAVICMNFFMSIFRAPTVALMPDATPPSLRSRANGYINFMGGLGSAIALYLGGRLFSQNENLPFFSVSALMVMALLFLILFYKEPKIPYSNNENKRGNEHEHEHEHEHEIINSKLDKNNKRTLFLLLSAVFFWFLAYNAVEAFFTLFCTDFFKISAGYASTMLAALAGSFLLFAIPSGYIGEKYGRKKTIIIGLFIMIVSCIIIILTKNITVVWILLITNGIGWALININSYPSVVAIAPKGQTGKYTGFYYSFSFASSIASPLLFGLIADISGSYGHLFIYSLAAFLVAVSCMLCIKEKSDCK